MLLDSGDQELTVIASPQNRRENNAITAELLYKMQVFILSQTFPDVGLRRSRRPPVIDAIQSKRSSFGLDVHRWPQVLSLTEGDLDAELHCQSASACARRAG